MSFGIPVVSTAVGGIPEIVREGVEGFLVAADDAPAVADRVLRLGNDPALRRRMGARARARAQEYSTQRMALRYLDLYRSLTATGPAAAH
jgi:glycosyltransferase involved in cell wall biosynthesis